MTKVFIADHQFLIREGLKSLLATRMDFTVVGEASTSGDLFEKLPSSKPDVVVIDFHQPEAFSMQDLLNLRQGYPAISVLVISTHQHAEAILQTIKLGIHTYILKECGSEEVLQALDAVRKGEKFFCGTVLDALLGKNVEQSSQLACEPVNLSAREIEIVQWIANGCTNKEVAEKLFLSIHTVTTHRKNILKKLHLRNTSELVLFAVKQGLVSSIGLN